MFLSVCVLKKNLFTLLVLNESNTNIPNKYKRLNSHKLVKRKVPSAHVYMREYLSVYNSEYDEKFSYVWVTVCTQFNKM